MQSSKAFVSVVSGLIVLAGSACGTSGSNNGSGGSVDANNSGASTAAAGSSSTTGSGDSNLSRAKHALATASDTVTNGDAYDLETEHYKGNSVWDIKVASGKKPEYELYVSADGGKVVGKEHKDSRDNDAAKAVKAKVTLSDALDTADKHSKGSPFDEAEIDSHKGTVVWTAKFKKSNGDREIIIDAKTGKMVGTKNEED